MDETPDNSVDKVTVFLLDDHELVREGVRQLLEADGTIEVVGEAGTCADAVTRIRATRPQVAILDVQLPDIDGFEVAARLTNGGGGPAVVLVSSRDGSDFGPLVERSGARGFIPKAELSGAALLSLLE